MTVVEIKRDKNHRVKVSSSDGTVFYLDLDYFKEISLHENDVITAEQIKEHIEASEYIRAKSRAMWFLDRADHSEKALYDKLMRGGIASEACARAVARLKELGLLDDERYAARAAERMRDTNVSRREAYVKLMQKGIPRDIANEALSSTEFDEAAQIRALIDKKYRAKMETEEGIQKVYAALVRKGFSYGAVRDVLKIYSEELKYSDV